VETLITEPHCEKIFGFFFGGGLTDARVSHCFFSLASFWGFLNVFGIVVVVSYFHSTLLSNKDKKK
jgi:hypothetical protein